MSESFFTSDEYDERAHALYNEGRYDDALALLQEGLTLYPNAVELHVGTAYALLAQEQFVWARHAFERALSIDHEHEDALAGLGELLLKFGDRQAALVCFERVVALGYADDHELMLQLGRACFREGLNEAAQRFFELACNAHPDSPEPAACLGYCAHRLNSEAGAIYWLRRALSVDPRYSEARIYLANLLYDRGESEAAMRHFDRTEPEDHYDELGLWRILELKRSLYRLPEDDPELVPWASRLHELLGEPDQTDMLLAEVEAQQPDGSVRDPNQLELFGTLLSEPSGMSRKPHVESNIHCVSTLAGQYLRGTWPEIVKQMHALEPDLAHSSLADFMASLAMRGRAETGVVIPCTDAEAFVRGSAEAGVLRIVS